MRKHWRLGLLFVAFVACVGGYVVWLGWRNETVSSDPLVRVGDGMTEAEVLAVVGRPPDYVGDGVWRWACGEGGACSVYFEHGRVARKAYISVSLGRESVLDRWRRWLLGR
jgi:hypothetical protein